VANSRFTRFAVADWSGAKGNRHKGIALAVCEIGNAAPTLVEPPGRIWSRRAILEWVLAQDDDILIAFDFSFAPPFLLRGSYLPGENVPQLAKAFWAYVDDSCDDIDLGAASFLERRYRRHFYFGAADGRKSDYMHFRRCEAAWNDSDGGQASTVYDAIGASQVAKASFAGMRLLHHANRRVPVWPFDPLPAAGPAIVEIYTTIAARASGIRKGRSKVRDGVSLDAALASFGCSPHAALGTYSDHATDAILTSAWLRRAAEHPALWMPPMLGVVAHTEGWTFGIL
jgi:hypothetical protein